MNIRALLTALALAFAAAASPASAQGGKLEVLWLGQSVFRITSPTGKVIVIDPFLINNPATPAQYKNIDALGKVDLVLVTHAHYDHFDDAMAISKKHNVRMYGPPGLNQQLLTLGLMPANLVPRFNKGGTVFPFPGIKITMTHAEHSSEFSWRPPSATQPEARMGGLPQKGDDTLVGGEPVGFVIEFENGFRIYHSGDTGVFGDMKLIGEHYKPDLVMLPIGGNFTMDDAEAAFATREYLKPKFAIPMHYGTSPLHYGTPEKFAQALAGAPVKVLPLKPGEKAEF